MEDSHIVKVETDIPTLKPIKIKEEVPEEHNVMQMTIKGSCDLVYWNPTQEALGDVMGTMAVSMARATKKESLLHKLAELHILISRLVSEVKHEPVPAAIRAKFTTGYDYTRLVTIDEFYLEVCRHHCLGLAMLFTSDRNAEEIGIIISDLMKLIRAMANNNCTGANGTQLFNQIVIPGEYMQIPEV